MNKQTAIFLSLLVASVSLTGCSSLPDFRKYVPEKIELPKINLKSKKDNQDEKKENSSNEKHVANPTDTTKSATAPKATQKVTKAEKNKRKVQAKSAQVATQQLRLSEKVLSGKWTIHSVSGHTVTGDDDQWPYIEFDVNTDRFYASNGCNLLNGRFKVESGQQIKMTDIIASRQQCPESEYPDINTQLSNVGSYSLSEKNGEYYLNLHNAKHLTIMVLRKHNIDFLNGPWRVSEINGQKCQNPDVKLVIDIPEGLIHGNTGCNILNGSLYEDPVKTHSIQFHNIVTTRTVSPDVATQAAEMALLIALEDVEYAKPGSHGSVKLLDKRHHTLLILEPIRND